MPPRDARQGRTSSRILAYIASLACLLGLARFRFAIPRAELTPVEGMVLYVSTQGNDAWSGHFPCPAIGRQDGPFRTIQRARDATRELKGRFKLPIFIAIRGGTYELKEPLVFRPEDSGTPGEPITYVAYDGEAPMISGGREIATPNVTVLPTKEVEAPLRNTSLHPEDTWAWGAFPPGVKEGRWYFRELFVNGQRRQCSRLPKVGFFYVDGKISDGSPAQFKFRPGDIRSSWAKDGDVEVVALLKWAEFRLPIKAVDDRSGIVTLARKRQDFGDDENPRYWIENARDAMDEPGEWYLDRRDGSLLYRPLPGEDIKRTPMVAPALKQLVRFEGDAQSGNLVHDITLNGLTFAYTDWTMAPTGYVDMQAAYDIPAAVELRGAEHCSIERCLFTHLGQYAVEVHAGSKADRIARNTMCDLGAGGVKIGDPEIPNDARLASGAIVVSDNRIFDLGKVYPAAVGVWIGQSGGNTIAHNDIHDTYYTGISDGWTWGYGPTAARDNVMESNLIYNIGRGMLSDMGCIYTLGVQPGSVERGNVCHDVTRYTRGYGGWGLYTDEGSSKILIENNLVYRAQDGGFHQHYGEANTVRNNIFAFGETAQIRRTRDEPRLSFVFEHDIVYWAEGKLLDGKWDDGNYRFNNNLYFRAGTSGAAQTQFGDWSFEEWQNRGQDAHSLIENPMFVAPDLDAFRLKPDSPALKLGFKPFDFTQAGPRR